MMRLSRLLTPLLIATAVILAGCGPLPQPFRGAPSVTSHSAIRDIPTAVGIAVLPVRGAPSPMNVQISDALAEDLLKLEIPAESVPYNAGLGFSLEGWADVLERTASNVNVEITWTLRSRSGTQSSVYKQLYTFTESQWRDGSVTASAQMSDETAQAIATLVGGDAPPQTATARAPAQPTLAFPKVSVKPVDGAPGDGRTSLMLAVLRSLSLNGVARDDVNPGVVLTCSVTIEPYDARLEYVEIIWQAVTPEGEEIGTVKLDNTIPVGALDEAWGPTAFAIADAAAPDLLNLLALVPSE